MLSVLFYLIYSVRVTSFKSIIAFIAVMLIFFIASSVVDLNDTLLAISKDVDSGGNGRTELASRALYSFFSSNVGDMIFGHGQGTVTRLLGMGAHNDFIEVLYEYGFIGFFLYLLFWISLIKRVFTANKTAYVYPVYIINIIIFCGCSLASKLLGTQIQMIPQCILIGIFWSRLQKKYRK